MRKFMHTIKFSLLAIICIVCGFVVDEGILKSVLFFVGGICLMALCVCMVMPDTSYRDY